MDSFDRDEIFYELQPVIKRLIRQYGCSLKQQHQIADQVYCLFLVALRRYDPGRGIPLRAHLMRHLDASIAALGQNGQRLRCAHGTYSLSRLISELEDPDRGILIRRYYGGYSVNDLAGWLDISEDEAQVLLTRAISALRAAVGTRRSPCGSPPPE